MKSKAQGSTDTKNNINPTLLTETTKRITIKIQDGFNHNQLRYSRSCSQSVPNQNFRKSRTQREEIKTLPVSIRRMKIYRPPQIFASLLCCSSKFLHCRKCGKKWSERCYKKDSKAYAYEGTLKWLISRSEDFKEFLTLI